jgi:glucuronokinase
VEIVRKTTHGRVGLLGNPSDGFYGKTIAAAVHNFAAEVVLYEWPVIEILPGAPDVVRFNTLESLADDVHVHGYYGGVRLVKAAIKRFYDWTQEQGCLLEPRNFSIRYHSNIPRQVGLAGSSAIIASTIRALMGFFHIEISKPLLANLVLSVETQELGISAGLQDRVAQVYDAAVFMDFERDIIESQGYGNYELFDPQLLPSMYLAYRSTLTHRDTLHNDVRSRFERGDPDVAEVMNLLAENAVAGRRALLSGGIEEFDRLLNRNFELRARIYPIEPSNQRMIDVARSAGASAKFPGSGGAIIGLCDTDKKFVALRRAFEQIGCAVLRLQFEPDLN